MRFEADKNVDYGQIDARGVDALWRCCISNVLQLLTIMVMIPNGYHSNKT